MIIRLICTSHRPCKCGVSVSCFDNGHCDFITWKEIEEVK